MNSRSIDDLKIHTDGDSDAVSQKMVQSETLQSEKSEPRSFCRACCCCCSSKIVDPGEDVEKEKQIQNCHSNSKASRHREIRSESAKKCRNCCKKFLTFLFSQIGLSSLVVAYAILGGFIFMELEAKYEQEQRNSVSVKRKEYISELWFLTKKLNVLYPKNWTIQADKIFSKFQKEIYKATKENGWDGKDGETVELQWTFAGSLLYAVTVITTIGYGHIAPKTFYGRLVTILYAIFGIPLTLLCLANLGQLFGNCFRFLYKHLCIFLAWLCCPHSKTKHEAKRIRSTKSHNAEQPLTSDDMERGTKEKSPDQNDINEDIHVMFEMQKNEKKSEKISHVRVPIFVSLLVMTLYIFGGAVLFTLWETQWDILIGAYFCFITLSTIGFGDFVPGASTDLANQEKLIICTFYLVFGLSMVAMCFNLMQEEVRAKCRWLGWKLGIIDNDRQ